MECEVVARRSRTRAECGISKKHPRSSRHRSRYGGQRPQFHSRFRHGSTDRVFRIQSLRFPDTGRKPPGSATMAENRSAHVPHRNRTNARAAEHWGWKDGKTPEKFARQVIRLL